MVAISRNQLAELRGCAPATVSRQRLPQIADKKYDLADPVVMDFVIAPHKKKWERDKLVAKASSPEDMGIKELEEEKLREEIEYKRRQTRKLDLQHEIAKRDLIPSSLMAIWAGYFASGIRNNFLSLGDRVARGDIKLRDKIEREIKKAIEKTISSAEIGLKKESEAIIKAMEE